MADLGDHAGPVGGDGADGAAQAGHPQDEGAQEHSERRERAGGVARLRLFEHRHAVGDGLHAGHGRAPTGKGAQEQEERHALGGGDGARVEVWKVTGDEAQQAPAQEEGQ